MSASHLTRLLAWFSPAFPIGAYAYSHGLEAAHEAGALPDRAALEAWVADLMEQGSGRADAILLAAAYGAALSGDAAGLTALNDLALALQPSAERHLESTTQGSAFLQAVKAAWPAEGLAMAPDGPELAYPIAVGLAAAAHDLPLPASLEAFLLAFAANLVSAGLRLGIVGQTDGQRITAALAPLAAAVAAEAATATLAELGSATLRSDIFSLRHETQYSRLFRS
jgi:urease accessory protein